jgi:photosystem II stability/assembly factor-like uncharacterized protein
MTRRLFPAAVVALVAVGGTLSAQVARTTSAPATAPAVRPAPKAPLLASVDPKLLASFRYRMIGPMQGGRVTTVTGVPSQPTTFYMGVASGGLWKTTNNGQSWLPITEGLPVASSGSVAVAESNPDVVYYGTGSDGARSNVSTGRGIYRSNDGGKTWSFVGLYDAGQIGAVRIHPTNPEIVWVSATGQLFGKNVERGIFKTIDGGKNWKKTLYINDSTGANDVEIMPGNPNVLYAAMGRLERKPWTIISGSPEGGLYKSTDGGETWNKLAGGLPTQLFGKANIALSAANPTRVYALIEATPAQGLFRSDDGGQTWRNMNSPAGMINRPFYYTTLGADPTNADIIYGGGETFYKSVNGGQTMTPMGGIPHTDHHDIWISPKDGKIMIQANDGGANVSLDGGTTWSTQFNQPTSEIYGVWMDEQIPYRIYGAQQDDGTHKMASNSIGGGEFQSGGVGCETGPIMPNPGNFNILYGSCKGIYAGRNLTTGRSYNYQIGGEELYGMIPSQMRYRFQRVSPMETGKFNKDVLYYGSQYVHRTTDHGATWTRISPDLTEFDPRYQFPSGGPITRDNTGEEFYSTLYAIAESSVREGIIWTGANDGPIGVSADNGKTWKKVSPPVAMVPKGGRVSWIDASPHRAGSAYAAIHRFLLGDFKPYIVKTNDFGVTWKLLTDGKNGIAADNPARVVREDPYREGLLYAGTEFGLFISFDDGGHWQPFSQNMPRLPINDLKVYRQDIVVATQGRGVWVMDNISPLEQITAQTATANVSLFKPRDAFRIRAAGGGGRGGGGGGGRGAGGRGATPAVAAPSFTPNPGGPEPEWNPATGAEINYYIVSAPSALTMEVRDWAGRVVRTLSSDAPAAAPAPAPAADAAPPARGGGGGGAAGGRGGGGGAAGGRGGAGAGASAPAARLPKDAGLNRFYWDMMHTDGTLMPPGNYTVKLSMGTWSSSQTLTLLVDPKVESEGVTAANLRDLYDHNRKATEFATEQAAVVARVRAARTRLANATGAAADTAKQVNAIALKLFGPDEGVRYGVPGLTTHWGGVAGMASRTADEKLSNQAVEFLAISRKQLDAIKLEVNKALGPVR